MRIVKWVALASAVLLLLAGGAVFYVLADRPDMGQFLSLIHI